LTGFTSSQIILTVDNKVSYETDYVYGVLHVILINESMRNFCFRTGYLELVHQVLVLCSSCIPVNVGVNQKGYSIKEFFFLLLALQPAVGFSLLSDSLPFCSFFTLFPPPS